MKLYKTVFILYLLALLWLVLFKFSLDVVGVLDYQARSLNLIPFVDLSRDNLRQMIDNVVVFIPFGLLLSINFKYVSFWSKLAFVSIFSLIVEMLQFVLAIGVTDITDVISNTLGGFLGLALYEVGKKYTAREKLDRFIAVVTFLLLILFILLRFLVFKVRYHSAP